MKLHYPQNILEKLSEEQIRKLKKGAVLRRCWGCKKFYVIKRKKEKSYCPRCGEMAMPAKILYGKKDEVKMCLTPTPSF